MNCQPVVIIGAPRSGTNILRDLLSGLPGLSTWPCDEINYIWRHGNARIEHDEFSPDMASTAVVDYIRSRFQRVAEETEAVYVVEKTCANSLRVSFVERVLPEARYIFLLRDGLDVVGSAMLRWQAGLNVSYVLRKARYVPFQDIPYYAIKYALNLGHQLLSSENRRDSWGPRMKNMDAIVRNHSLMQVCALQWKACVERAHEQLGCIDERRVHRVRYEEFVMNPKKELESILRFLKAPPVEAELTEQLAGKVSAESIGKGRKRMAEPHYREILPLIEGTLCRFGYGHLG